MPLKPCLCLMFNHALSQQLPLFRDIYGGRFSQLRFIQPLQRSADPDVITVYRGSYTFPAYLTDACARLMEVDCTHFLFMHDDVLLSPALNEANLCEVLDVRSEAEGFTPSLALVDSDVGGWMWWPGVLWRWLHPRNLLSGTGLDSIQAALAALPPLEAAREKMRRYGVDHGPRLTLDASSVERWGNPQHFGVRDDADVERFNSILLEGLFSDRAPGEAVELPYPIAITGAYSDFSLIPKRALPEVAHIAGVLCAAGLFAEMVLGTAMALAVEHVRLADETGLEFEWLYDSLDPEAILARMAEFPSLIAAHALKMSRIADQAGLVRRLKTPGPIDIAARKPHGTVLALAADFDPKAYAAANPDVPERFARHHYKLHGHAEGRPLRP